MSTALVLAGHGSHISPQTAGLVWKHVDMLRSLNAADEVTAAFWKEMPSYARVFDSLEANDITVVPLFTANGYFTQTVIPAEMGLTGTLTERGNRLIRYTPALHEHPYLATIVRKRVETALQAFDLPHEQTAVAIIGHSTRRSPDSRKATENQVRILRDAAITAQVEAVYLDDAPEIAGIYDLTDAPYLIAVPYFLASGSHTTVDVPLALGLTPGVNRGVIRQRHVFYTPPVGIDDELLDVILALARDAGMPLPSRSSADTWGGFPRVGCTELAEVVTHAKQLRFGDLMLTENEVRVWVDSDTPELISTPHDLRARVRNHPFRSLATAKGLPDGWRIIIESPSQLAAVVETVYPGAVAHWAVARTGRLVTTPLSTLGARQTGMYHVLETMSIPMQQKTVDDVCSSCVQCPQWFRDCMAEQIPCPEPCNHWLSSALERYE